MILFLHPDCWNLQVEDVAAQLQAARSESNVLRQQLAESDALVTSLREEQVVISFI